MAPWFASVILSNDMSKDRAYIIKKSYIFINHTNKTTDPIFAIPHTPLLFTHTIIRRTHSIKGGNPVSTCMGGELHECVLLLFIEDLEISVEKLCFLLLRNI